MFVNCTKIPSLESTEACASRPLIQKVSASETPCFCSVQYTQQQRYGDRRSPRNPSPSQETHYYCIAHFLWYPYRLHLRSTSKVQPSQVITKKNTPLICLSSPHRQTSLSTWTTMTDSDSKDPVVSGGRTHTTSDG